MAKKAESELTEQLAESLRQLTHFLGGLWSVPDDPGKYMRIVIDRILQATTEANELPHVEAAVQAVHVLRRARIIIGRDRDVNWCNTPEEAAELVEKRMATAYDKCGKELESLATTLLVSIPATEVTPATPMEKRNEWLYRECCKGTKYKTIVARLRQKPKTWPRISRIQGVKNAANRYAKRHGLPPIPSRQPGRPSK